MYFKPSIARYSITINGDGLKPNSSYQVANSAHEIVSVLVNGATGPIAVRVFDRNNGDVTLSGSPRQDDNFLVQAEASNSFEYRPTQPRQMKNGILINFEQGQTNGEVTILFN